MTESTLTEEDIRKFAPGNWAVRHLDQGEPLPLGIINRIRFFSKEK